MKITRFLFRSSTALLKRKESKLAIGLMLLITLAATFPALSRPIFDPNEPYDPPVNPPTPTPTPPDPVNAPLEYRLRTVLQRDSPIFPITGNNEVEAFAFFEKKQNADGSWQPFKAQKIMIACYLDGMYRDGETERDASKVDVEFSVFASAPERRVVTCNYSANDGAYTNTLTIFLPA